MLHHTCAHKIKKIKKNKVKNKQTKLKASVLKQDQVSNLMFYASQPVQLYQGEKQDLNNDQTHKRFTPRCPIKINLLCSLLWFWIKVREISFFLQVHDRFVDWGHLLV